MNIVVIAADTLKEEFGRKPLPEAVSVQYIDNVALLKQHAGVDAVFDLQFEPLEERIQQLAASNKPVFINTIHATLTGLPSPFIRICAWPGFLGRELVELAVADEAVREQAAAIMQQLTWKHIFVPDQPGMVTPRVISMIINEAYYALGEGVSTKEEIDTAMKLGTNYPYGPFEWSEKIGLAQVYQLLGVLSSENERYHPAPAMEKAMRAWH